MRLSSPLLRLVALLAALPVIAGFAQTTPDDIWTPPTTAVAPAQLPALAQPLALDGELTEWAGAVCIPVRSRSSIIYQATTHEWRGTGDAGMEVYCAWNKDGLCLAAIVADDDVRNNRPDDLLYQQDCVELFVDGRIGDAFMKRPYSAGCFQFFVKPPTAAGPAALVIPSSQPKAKGQQVAGKNTTTGYTVEILIPWSNFPGFSPKTGSQLGLQCSLDEYDARDATTDNPLILSYQAAIGLYESPQKFVPCKLVEQAQTGEQFPLGPAMAVDVPGMLLTDKPLPVSVDISPSLAPAVRTVRLRVTTKDGKHIADHTITPTALAAPWAQSLGAGTELKPAFPADGYYLLQATPLNANGQPLGSATRPFLYAAGTLEALYSRLQRANVAALSQTDPFKASAYLGAAACVEKFKRSLERANPTDFARDVREATARLELLEKGTFVTAPAGLLDLLTLTAEPRAQVVTTFSGDTYASVMFNWGSLPLAHVTVRQYPTEEEARKALDTTDTWVIARKVEQTIINGHPATVTVRNGAEDTGRLADFAPDQQVLLVTADAKSAVILNVADIGLADVDAVVTLASCPKMVRDAVKTWAKGVNCPAGNLKDGLGTKRLLIAGDIRVKEITEALAKTWVSEVTTVAAETEITVCDGARVMWSRSPARQVAWRAAELVLAGKPVTEADADALREDLVKAMAPKAAPFALPDTVRLYCGDLHMHTFYSDGTPSPVGISLQAMHCFLDFAVISDHNTLAGAQLAQQLFAEHGFSYPITVGEEVTVKWIHMNAYPLKEVVRWDLPLYEMIKAAHVQGAVIQWNHPGYPGTDPVFDTIYMKNGGAGAGFDAWEHVSPSYDRWKRQAMLPVITGTTDTHNGTFDWPERTIIIAPSPQGEDIAEAVRLKQVVALSATQGHLFYGSDRLTALAWSMLAEGAKVKADTAERLKAALKTADLVGVLRASAPRVVSTEKK